MRFCFDGPMTGVLSHARQRTVLAFPVIHTVHKQSADAVNRGPDRPRLPTESGRIRDSTSTIPGYLMGNRRRRNRRTGHSSRKIVHSQPVAKPNWLTLGTLLVGVANVAVNWFRHG